MSDPQPDRLKKKPARAEPLQPDRPARGGDTAPPGGARDEVAAAEAAAERAREQADTALKNNTQGRD